MKLENVPVNLIKASSNSLRFMSLESHIDDLTASIDGIGLINPLTVINRGNEYELVCGQRRFNALKKLKKEKVPCIVLDLEDEKRKWVIALTENLEQEPMTPAEQGEAYRFAVEKLGIGVTELAGLLNKHKSEISNKIRALKKLHPEIIKALHTPFFDFGHALALMKLPDKMKQLKIFKLIQTMPDWTVNDTILKVNQEMDQSQLGARERELNELERKIELKLKDFWRRKVNIRQGKKQETLVLKFEDREDLLDLLLKIKEAIE